MIVSDYFKVSNSDKTLTAHYDDLLRQEVKNSTTLSVLSAKTNLASLWEYAGTSRVMSTGIDYDMFIPTKQTLEMFPQLKGYTIKIFDDK